jgi:PAS domain S-box-containing protein
MSHALFRTQRREATAREKQRQSEASYGAIFEQAAVGIARVARMVISCASTPSSAPSSATARRNCRPAPSWTSPIPKICRPTWSRCVACMPTRYPASRGRSASCTKTAPRSGRASTSPWCANQTARRDYRIGVIEDIASQKMTDEALRERERRLAAIIGFSPSALSLKTPDGRYALANPNLQRIHHCDEAGIVGKTDFDLYPDEVARAFRANDQRVLATRSRQSVEESVPVEGEMRAYLSHMFPVVDDKGEVEYICRISLDITEHKRTEAAQKASSALQEQARRATLSLLGGRPGGPCPGRGCAEIPARERGPFPRPGGAVPWRAFTSSRTEGSATSTRASPPCSATARRTRSSSRCSSRNW